MKGCADFGVQISKEECQEVFQAIDKDNSGTIDFDEFLQALRPPLSNARLNLINQAFIKMDKTKDGVITAEDLKGVYNVSKHPKYLNGEWTEDQVFAEYLKTFEVGGEVDATVTKEEFINYYSGLSASIDNDAYFDLMMRNAFKL
ncbi:unnamed protein product [Schistocephalus solidus]|uniref:Calcyphosin-like protein n=1 Tax=Schistocephalus solidus TaxID=70667 RepID=A0A183TRD3_SCHSO|nr:unnamed protein product [Schistocephalus solidus]